MLTDNSEVADLLDYFGQMAEDFPAEIPWCIDLGRKDSAFTTVFGCAIHGNEIGSLPAIISLLNDLTEEPERLNGRYLFFIGNPDAVRAGSRYIERDLNRCFNLNDDKTLEGKRSLELAKILAHADLFADYHQTNQPAMFPFFTFAYHEQSYRWAAHMQAAQHFVTRDMRVAFSSEGMCGDEWVRNRGRAAVTLELGKAGLSHSAHQITLKSLRRVVGFIETELEKGRIPEPQKPASGDDLQFFEVAAKIAWPGDDAALLSGLENFQYVSLGQELGKKNASEKIVAPVDGYLMFPKYPKRKPDGSLLEAQGGDIVQLVRPLERHPRVLWG